MSVIKSFGKMTAALLLCVPTALLAAGQTPAPAASGPFSAAELDRAGKTAKKFCAHWKSQRLDSMESMMSEAARAAMPKERFDKTYGAGPDKSGRPASFSVKEARAGDDGAVVRVVLTFVKQKSPSAVNGIYNFHMVEENGKWKVKAVVPPIAPPEVEGSGGHPGE